MKPSENNVAPFRRTDPGLPPCGCDGSGWSMTGTGPDGRPTARPCAGCVSARLVRQFGEARTWATWTERAELRTAVKQLRGWLEHWRADRVWACLLHASSGKANFGTGKSHACQAVAHEWAVEGIRPRYVTVPDYLAGLRADFDSERPSAASLAEFDGLLILDDLGLEKRTEWTQEQLEAVGDWRYRHRLPTLIASNLDKRALDSRYPRLVDRCHEGLVIEWGATSWRRR
jgi:hypothetical protein